MAKEAAAQAPAAAKAGNPVVDKIQLGKSNLVARLPKGMDKDRFFLGILTAIQKSKANAQPGKSLADCDPNSVLLAAFDAAEVGCSLSPSLQLGWLIPYGKEAQFQPSYRFFIQKAYETNEVKTIYAEVVYEGDEFSRQLAPKKNLFHAPGDGPRLSSKALGAYALIEFSDGTIDFEYLTAEQIKRHRDHSKQPNSMMWTSFWEEGWRKTPIRVLAKRLPLKNRNFEGLVEMINKDTDRDTISIDASVETEAAQQPRRLSEAQPAQTQAEQTQTQQHEKENVAAKAPATQAGGSGAPPQATNSTMFPAEEEGDPFLNEKDISLFWDAAFKADWTKKSVLEYLKKEFKVDALKELRKSQLESVLDGIRQARE